MCWGCCKNSIPGYWAKTTLLCFISMVFIHVNHRQCFQGQSYNINSLNTLFNSNQQARCTYKNLWCVQSQLLRLTLKCELEDTCGWPQEVEAKIGFHSIWNSEIMTSSIGLYLFLYSLVFTHCLSTFQGVDLLSNQKCSYIIGNINNANRLI